MHLKLDILREQNSFEADANKWWNHDEIMWNHDEREIQV